jgi:hypothetical protein
MRRRRPTFRRPANCYPRYWTGGVLGYIRAFELINHLKATV